MSRVRDPDSSPSSAGGSVRPHLRVLRAVGFCRLAPAGGTPAPAGGTPAPAGGTPAPAGGTPAPARGTPALQRRLHGAYHVFALCFNSAYVLQQLIYAYQAMGDMEKLSRVLFVLLCHVTCVAKQLVFHVDAARVDALLAGLDEPLFNRAEGAAARRGAARGAGRLLYAYAGCAQATCVLWAVVAVENHLRGLTSELPFWIGFRYDQPLAFVAVLAYSLYATSLVAVGNTTMDAFVATILHQCKTQLTIVRNNFEGLEERARAAALRSGRPFEALLHETFVDCLLHYRKIIESCSLLEEVFGVALLLQFTVSGWILCMAAYKIISLNVLSIEFASMTLFIICILTELLLYCYYGNEVTVESERVVGSLYAMRWEALGPRFGRALLVVMTRAQRPLRPAAGRVIPLTLQTYVTILKSSYSFYAVLRQTK